MGFEIDDATGELVRAQDGAYREQLVGPGAGAYSVAYELSGSRSRSVAGGRGRGRD